MQATYDEKKVESEERIIWIPVNVAEVYINGREAD